MDQLIKSQLLYQLSYRGNQRTQRIVIRSEFVNIGMRTEPVFRYSNAAIGPPQQHRAHGLEKEIRQPDNEMRRILRPG